MVLAASVLAVAILAKQSAVDDPFGGVVGQCESWLKDVDRGAAAFFVDSRRDGPEACEALGATMRACCPGNFTLGRSRATAQYKREVAHAQVLAWLEETGSPARWVLTTEYDAWFDVPKLLAYLEAVEASVPKGVPIVAGNWQGPFTILNRAMLAALSDRAFVDACRDRFLRCRAAPRPAPPECHDVVTDGTVPGALYNDDQLVAFCAGRVADAIAVHPPGPASDCREPGLLGDAPKSPRQFVVVHNRAGTPPEAQGWAARPPNLLAFHHVGARGMAHLSNLTASGRPAPGLASCCRKANVEDGQRERRGIGARRRRRWQTPSHARRRGFGDAGGV